MKPTKEQTARHEAAHFVVAWAVDRPFEQVDTTPAARKGGTLAYNDNGCWDADESFERVVIMLAGPVADGWGKTSEEIIEAENQYAPQDGRDWTEAIRTLADIGIDTENKSALNPALSWCLDVVRSILTECMGEWREVEAYLVEHGRIGFNGEHPDGAQEATFRFFYHWGETYEKVQPLVERLRSEFYGFAHDTIYEHICEHK